jgi:hypothetical protein
MSTCVVSDIECTYMVNTIPPLRIKRPNRGSAPDQKVSTPSSLKILAAHWKLFLYRLRASIDCILFHSVSICDNTCITAPYLVLTVSIGIVV